MREYAFYDILKMAYLLDIADRCVVNKVVPDVTHGVAAKPVFSRG